MNHRYDEFEARLQHALCIEKDLLDSIHFQKTLEQAKGVQQRRLCVQNRSILQNAFIIARRTCSRFILLQTALLVLSMLVVSKLFEGYSISKYSLDTIIGAVSILSILSSVPYLKSSKVYCMLELETVSCTAPITLVLAKTLPVLLSELGLLVGIVLFSASSFGIPTERVLLSALLPYLTVSTLSGSLLIWSEGQHISEICLAVGAMVFCILHIRKVIFPVALFENGIAPGYMICAILAGVSLLQTKQLLQIMFFQNEVTINGTLY